MPKVTIQKQCSLQANDVFHRVKNLLDNDPDLRKLDPSFKCQFNESALSGNATGKMFKADMSVKSISTGTEVTIIVDLPLALTLAKGMVEKTLSKKLESTLAG